MACGVEFQKTIHDSPDRRYCSRECSSNAKRVGKTIEGAGVLVSRIELDHGEFTCGNCAMRENAFAWCNMFEEVLDRQDAATKRCAKCMRYIKTKQSIEVYA